MPKESSKTSQPVAPAASLETKVQQAVDQWYVERMHNSVVSRDTDVHNLIHEAKPALVQAILAVVSQPLTQE
jgi:hypothetical protein